MSMIPHQRRPGGFRAAADTSRAVAVSRPTGERLKGRGTLSGIPAVRRARIAWRVS